MGRIWLFGSLLCVAACDDGTIGGRPDTGSMDPRAKKDWWQGK